MNLHSLRYLASKIKALGEEQRDLKKVLSTLEQTLDDGEFTELAQKHNAIVFKKAELINQYNQTAKRNIQVGVFKQTSF